MARVLPFPPSEIEAPDAATAAQPRIGDVLVASGALAGEDLGVALALQAQQDARLGQILIANRMVDPEALTEALSRQSGLGRIDFERTPPDAALLDGLDPYRCLEVEAVPWRQIGGTRVIALANPAEAEAAAAACGGGRRRLAFAVVEAEAIRRTVIRHFAGQLRADANRRCPEAFSCRRWTERLTARRLWAPMLVIGASAAIWPIVALQILMGWIVVISAATTGLRLAALFARFRGGAAPAAAAPRLADHRKLPPVSILVPLYREETIAHELIEALTSLDYPAALLDIKLVLEEADAVTRAAIARIALPGTIEVVGVPADALRTKPRAMNYALPLCRGEIVGVYDAEDRPEPMQIRAVVTALGNAAPDVACVQGYLDFHNTGRNWITRCFTIEYAIWFRVLLHGVQRLGIPIPLGGTTVFFRRRVLEAIGAWDAHNVTEDADLGMRLARFGYRCEMIASTTMEEATIRPRDWVRQRSRWLKGYAITWATHMRAPRLLLGDLGWRGFLGFQVLFLGAITSYLAIPLFWVIGVGSVGFDLSFWRTLPAPLMWSFFSTMILGQAVMLAVAVVALWRPGRRRLIPWIATLLVYWPLGALAAYRALAEIFYAPFVWHKTAHGVGRRPGRPSPARAAQPAA